MDKCTKYIKILSLIIMIISFAKIIKDIFKAFLVILNCTKLLKVDK